ncbi:hypothetical protein LOK49_LG13G00308 [Camellia lanceoleosa]|uniref:Uncharacterized protein n=1 Tax=Camellia lanceoleosa TaxID=1840588 RepID=A0ACC0FJ82_9ERIC|nr:hypothetical protein LOK49_LG13G00308 [Camellia lanceoleosa]
MAITYGIDLELAYIATYARRYGLGQSRGGGRGCGQLADDELVQTWAYGRGSYYGPSQALGERRDDEVAPPLEVIFINSDDDEDSDELDEYFNDPYPNSSDFGSDPSDDDDKPGGVVIP